MSIPVKSTDLRTTRAGFGSAFLLTTASPQVKVVIVDPVVEADGTIRFGEPGRGTRANLADNPRATLTFWPPERHGHALLVDGSVAVDDEGCVMQVEGAVLHRPAAHADGPVEGDGCGDDCRPVES